MLNLILGRTGSGKTEYLIEFIRQNIDSKKLMLIVPEQYSFETERRLLRELGSSKAIDVQVLSFTRLSARIFRDCGGLAGRYIDDGGRNILMSVALEQVKDNLTLYAGQAMVPAFASTMVQTVSEFKMCRISSDLLEEAIKMQKQESLKQKLQEISLIMSTYDALMASSFNDSLDDLTRLAKKLDEFHFFNGYTVMLDGFTSFTPQENKVIAHIIKQSQDIFVSLCAPSLIDNDEGIGLFSPVLETVQSLLRVARKYDVSVSKPIIITPSKRYNNEALKHLEAWIFRNSATIYQDISSEINLLTAPTIFDEVEYIAGSIRKLVREKGYRYREIVVIARDISTYKGILDAVFGKYDIPLFMDRRQELDGKPLFALVLAALDIISKGWRREDVLRYLKTGLTGISFEDISLFENYTYMYDIRGARFCSEFKSHPRGYIKDMSESDSLILANINEIRAKIVEPLQAFGQKLKNSDGWHISKAIYELLMELDAANRIKSMAEDFYNSGELLISDEYLRLWDMLMDTLDQFSIALSGVRCSAKRCSELMRLVISGLDIGSIPPSLDEVVAGSADRIRVGGVKAAFIIGVNEGVFPQIQSINGIFSDTERQALIDSGLSVSPASIHQAVEEMFIAYSAICSASDEVTITYSLSDISGGSLRQSYIIPMIKRLFPNIKQHDIKTIELEQRVENEQSAFEMMAANWNNNSKFITGLKEYFKENEVYSDKYHALLRAVDRKPAAMNDRNITRELFGKNMRLSPTRLEQFHQCKFAYFCKYGLKAQPKKKASLEAPEIGTLIHFVMENIIASTMDKGIQNYPQKELKSMVRKLLSEYIADYMGGSEEKSARFKYLFSRLANLVDILVQQIVDELSQSQFSPVDFELAIGSDGDIEAYELKTFDGGSIQVEGKVDRVDTMRKNDKAYVRIIDYKTGSKDFSLSDVLYGLNMQMLIYLFTIWQNGKERYGDIVPCGVLYMPAVRPIADVDRNADEAEAESDRKSILKMKGILLDDPEVIFGMEAEAKGIFIPASIKADGSISAVSKVASLEQLGLLKRHIENLLYKLADTLYMGDIAAVPIKGGTNDPCRYCDYMAVCGFEEGKTSVRNLVKFKDNELFDMMKDEENVEFRM